MPIFSGFRSTSISKAFLLAAIVSALTISLALLGKDFAERHFSKIKDFPPLKWEEYAIALIVAFLATYSSLWLMKVLFGFGGGMLTH